MDNQNLPVTPPPTNITSQPAIPPVINPQPPRKPSRVLPFLFGFLLLLLLGVAAVLGYQNLVLRQQLQPSSQTGVATPTPCPSGALCEGGSAPTVSPTPPAWLSHTLSPLNLSFRFPPTFHASSCQGGVNLYTDPNQNSPTYCENSPRGDIQLTYQDKPFYPNYQDNKKFRVETTTRKEGGRDITQYVVVKLQDTTGPDNAKYLVIKINNSNLIFSTQNPEYYSLMDMMLATLKPVSSSTTQPPSEWKTYTNDLYHFTIRYPQDLYYEELDRMDKANQFQLGLRPIGGDETMNYMIVILVNKSFTTIDDHINHRYCSQPSCSADAKDTFIAGQAGKLLITTLGNYPFSRVVTYKMPFTYEINVELHEGYNQFYSVEKKQLTFDQIIASFQFTN